MKDLKIILPEGYEIDKEKSTFEHIVFKELPKRGKTWEDIIQEKYDKKETMRFLNSCGEESEYEMGEASITDCTNHVNTSKQVSKLRALAELFVIMDYYNDGWVVNNGQKFFTFCYNKSSESVVMDNWTTHQINPIYFKTQELAQEAYDNNKEIFDTFFKP